MKTKIDRKVHVVDASTLPLGRLASKIATLLIGKNKSDYQPHIDNGDIVLVENIKQIKVTGRKAEQKIYYSHSGFPGGLKEKKYKDVFKNNPFTVLQKAVKGMLPKTTSQISRIKRLRIK